MNRENLVSLTREFIHIPSECTVTQNYRDICLSIKSHMEAYGIETEVLKAESGMKQGWDITTRNDKFPLQSTFSWFDRIDESVLKNSSQVEKYSVIGQIGSGNFTLIIHGHLDTRRLGNECWQFPPFSGEVRKGRIWGLGAADNKSGIALAIECIEDIQHLEKIKVILIFTADEEMGGYTGMGYLTEHLDIPKNFVLSTNGPFYKVNIGCWGRLWVAISVEIPSSFQNKLLYQILDPNISAINRELRRIAVPLQVAHIERLQNGIIIITSNVLSGDFSLAQLYSILSRTAPQFDFGIKVLGISNQVVSKKNSLFENLSLAIKSSLEKELSYQMGPISDIRFSLMKGIDAAAFGPISKESNVHKPDENVYIENLTQCVKIYRRFILDLDSSMKL